MCRYRFHFTRVLENGNGDGDEDLSACSSRYPRNLHRRMLHIMYITHFLLQLYQARILIATVDPRRSFALRNPGILLIEPQGLVAKCLPRIRDWSFHSEDTSRVFSLWEVNYFPNAQLSVPLIVEECVTFLSRAFMLGREAQDSAFRFPLYNPKE